MCWWGDPPHIQYVTKVVCDILQWVHSERRLRLSSRKRHPCFHYKLMWRHKQDDKDKLSFNIANNSIHLQLQSCIHSFGHSIVTVFYYSVIYYHLFNILQLKLQLGMHQNSTTTLIFKITLWLIADKDLLVFLIPKFVAEDHEEALICHVMTNQRSV